MSFSIDNMPSQKGRIAVVTGANTGLGFETALVLASKGGKVIM
ncbi:MAG: NAD(P)-dependent dehydrogenase (short-subunit alcohol dehydrogenase family), partial [Bacteroidia bacterium]